MLARMIVTKWPHMKTGFHWSTLTFQQNFIIRYNRTTRVAFSSMCYWNRKCCAKLRFGGLLWTVFFFFMIWPQFGGRTRWRSSFDSWARALAKLAVTNEFSSFALARRITNNYDRIAYQCSCSRQQQIIHQQLKRFITLQHHHMGVMLCQIIVISTVC